MLSAALPGLRAQPIQVRAESGRIRVSPSTTHFLDGKTLEKLHNGASVTFAIQVALLTGNRGVTLARAAGRFAVSFDIWEEKFAVAQLASSRRSASHLSAAEAEGWCLDNLILGDAGLSPDASFWIRLDVRAEEPDESPPAGEDAGITLARLVEVFSRGQRAGETRNHAEGGPFRLRDLR
jgi:hypothetical protein